MSDSRSIKADLLPSTYEAIIELAWRWRCSPSEALSDIVAIAKGLDDILVEGGSILHRRASGETFEMHFARGKGR
jgi:hypothetical protein